MVTALEHVMQLYCVVCGDISVYSNNSYRAMLLCCLWSLLWLNNSRLSAKMLSLCGFNCGYSNNRYSEMLLCCVWS